MHGIYSSNVDTFTSSNAVGQTIPTPNSSPTTANPTHGHLIANFVSASVTGAGAQLSFDVLINGVWQDSGMPAVSITGSISGTLQGITNAQIIQAAVFVNLKTYECPSVAATT
jgi:hypothetical protein